MLAVVESPSWHHPLRKFWCCQPGSELATTLPCPRLCGAGLCWDKRVMVVNRAFSANPAPSLPCGMGRQRPGGTRDPSGQLRIHPRDAGQLVFPSICSTCKTEDQRESYLEFKTATSALSPYNTGSLRLGACTTWCGMGVVGGKLEREGPYV